MKDNKLIAEFMDWKLQDNPKERWHNSYRTSNGILHKNTNTDPLLFHSSWDWMMPVVEKIEMLGYTFEKNYQPIDKDWQCLIVKGLDILHQEFDESSIKATHYVVVDFIKRTKKST